jgi:hypothetical protein
LAEFRVAAGETEARDGEVLVYRLEARKPCVSRRKEDAFLLKTGDEVTQAAAEAGLPFEAVTAFLKKAGNVTAVPVSLYGPRRENRQDEGRRVLTGSDKGGKGGSLMEEEKIQFEEAKLIAEEIAKRNMDYLPDEEEEIVTPDELENLMKGE